MLFKRKAWLRGICATIILLTIAVMPFGGISDSSAQAAETSQFQLASINPDFLEFWENPPEPFYGYIPSPMDLSHLNEIPVVRARGFATLPTSFDWRDQGKVTSVKNQNPCGTCWVFGTTSAIESKVLIEESVEYNFSEQNLACCTDPAWVYLIGNRCMGGGNSFLVHNTLSKKGTRLEACQPYNTGTIDTEACDDECDSIKMITDYRMIADPATSPGVVALIKDAVCNHGPLAMSYCHDDSHLYAGNIYYWPGCTQSANHLVCIVGWDDDIVWPGGAGSGAWIVKNSWGTGWGDSGFFYMCYGSANMCEVASLDYKDYEPNEQMYYWDEAGLIDAVGCVPSSASAWMANIFTSSQDGNLTHVDFWTTSNNANYDLYVYRDGDISNGLQNRATSQSGTCAEYGYYSIPLGSPVSLTSGEAFTIAVKMTTPGFNYPLPVEYQVTGVVDPPIQTGVSYARCSDTGAWDDLAPYGYNACLRARITSEAAIVAPTVTTNAATSVEETSATGHGDITSTGGETCDKRGVCWSISSGPDISDSKSEENGTYGTGAFTVSMTGLAQGTKYYVRAYAHNSAGYGYGNEVTFTTKPDAPTSFSATTASTSQIDLSWTKGDGAQKTKIQRKEGGYPTHRNDGTEVYFGTGDSKSDTGLSPGTTYYYCAWSEVSGSQQWSDNYAQDSATTSVPVTVAAPAGVKTGANFTAQVNISEVTDFDAADFEVVFDSSVLEVENITADITDGLIGTTTIPIVSANEISAGKVKILVNVEGTPGVTGSGYLCQIRFHAIGAAGTSGTINLQNGSLLDKNGAAITAVWAGDSVNVLEHALGDANGDDVLNCLDITKIELIVAEVPGHYPPESDGADANQDGAWNALDITLIEILVAEA